MFLTVIIYGSEQASDVEQCYSKQFQRNYLTLCVVMPAVELCKILE